MLSIKKILHQVHNYFCIIDNNDLIHGFGLTENDPYGLQRRFSSFMDNMTEKLKKNLIKNNAPMVIKRSLIYVLSNKLSRCDAGVIFDKAEMIQGFI